MVSFHGRWRITVTEKEAGYDQRVVIEYANVGAGTHAGVPGTSFVVDGDDWELRIEHDDGSGWSDSLLQPGPVVESGAELTQVIGSEDLPDEPPYDWNDLVVRAEKVGPMLEIEYRPYAVNPATLEMHPDGVFVGLNGIQYMGVKVTNRWGRRLHSDTYLAISTLGRATLAAQGIQVLDAWSVRELESVGQTLAANGIAIGSLDVDESQLYFFKVDAAGARKGTPPVEVQTLRLSGVPDAGHPNRFDRHKIFIAEVGYDFSTNEAVAAAPEGVARLKLHQVIVDQRGMRRACDEIATGIRASDHRSERLRSILEGLQRGRCDAETMRAIMALFCECLEAGGGRGGRSPGGDDVPGFPPGFIGCAERFFWLPAEFEYTVDVGGFNGTTGPLPFEDPWWKIFLLIIAVIAAIIAAIADQTGLGKSQDSIRIGTVGAHSLNNVDAALIDLDNSRGFRQSVTDAIAGEPHQSPEIALNAVIDIDPQVAPAFVGMHVLKSGARTGLTHGIVTSINAPVNQCRGTWDATTSTCTPDSSRPNLLLTNQIAIAQDPAFGEPTTDPGDSGSLWLSDEPGTRYRVVALTHSGGATSSSANPIGDVLNRLNVRLGP